LATLTALKFSTPKGAEQMLDQIQSLQKVDLIDIHDAALVSWPVGEKKPKTEHLANLAGVGGLKGAFWGLLFGMIFMVPVLGLAVGAAFGVLNKKMANIGIDENFIKQTREKVTEGTSALFLLTSDAVQDKVIEALKGYDFELISSNLTKEQEAQLMEAFTKE
jgi:uncharacterized membrane protein